MMLCITSSASCAATHTKNEQNASPQHSMCKSTQVRILTTICIEYQSTQIDKDDCAHSNSSHPLLLIKVNGLREWVVRRKDKEVTTVKETYFECALRNILSHRGL